jgi:hypothetical protein
MKSKKPVARPNMKSKSIKKAKPKKKPKAKPKGKRKAVKGVPLTEMETFILVNGGKIAMNEPKKMAEGAKALKDKAFELAEHDSFMTQQLKLAEKSFSDLSREKKAIWLFLIAFDPAIRQTLWKKQRSDPKFSQKYFAQLKFQVKSAPLEDSVMQLVHRYAIAEKK